MPILCGAMSEEEYIMRRVNRLISAALCSSMLVPAAAYAQDNANPQSEEEEIDDNVIIVTATRRAENLQDIPLAVTAVSTEELNRQGINDIRGLSSVSASFNMNSSDTETGGTTLRIRGIGTTGNNIGLESSVGVFLDGVYLSRPGAALGDLVDVERVEILRGPQGTLFGRNTSAGALTITTKKPNLNELEGFANASYGNFDFLNFQAGVSLPLVADTLGVRFTGAYRKRDGFLTNGAGQQRNTRDRYSLRGQVYWEPSPTLSIRLIADFSSADEVCCEAVQLIDTATAPTFALVGLGANNGGAPNVGLQTIDARQGNSTGPFDNGYNNLGLSGEINWEFSDTASLTYIGSYRDFGAFSTRSTDYVSTSVFSVGVGDAIDPAIARPNSGPIKTWTHELRLQGEAFEDRFSWLVGAYYSDEKIRTDSGILGLGVDYAANEAAVYTGGNLALINGITGGGNFAGSFADNRFSQDATSWSIFTHNSFDITDTLTATIGLRYTDDHKEGSFVQAAANNPSCLATVALLNGAIAGNVLNGLTGAANGLAGLNCFVFATPADLPSAFDNPLTAAAGDGLNFLPRTFGAGAQGGAFDEFNDDEFIYTGKLAWKPTPDVNTYISFSHGYKSGGYNLDASASVGGADPRFASETIDVYEFGLKAALFDGRGTFNLAIFHQEASNFQVLEFTGIQFETFNVPTVKSTGAEIEFQAQFSDQISTNIALTYTDARYPADCDNGAVDSAQPNVSSLCGNDLTNAPDFVGNFGMVFQDTINDAGWSVTASGSVRFESSRRTSTQTADFFSSNPSGAALFTNPATQNANGTGLVNGVLPFVVQEANFKFNGRIGISSPDERFTFELWGVNIFDEQTRSVTFSTPLRGTNTFGRSRSAFIDAPGTYGCNTARQILS